MCHFSFWPFRRKEGGKCAIVYPGDVREIRAFAEQNAWQFYLILACTRVFTLRQHDQSYLCSNLLWELQQHSQKLEKKTTLITQTCHLSYDLDDMPLKAGLPECHRQSWSIGTKANALSYECKWCLHLFGKSWELCATILSFLCRLLVKIFFSCRKYLKSFPRW